MNSQLYVVSKEVYNIIEQLNNENKMGLLERDKARRAQIEADIEVIKNWNTSQLKGAKRLEGESFPDYKDRRRQENLWYKMYKTPGAHLVWLSKTIQHDEVNKMQFWSPGNTYIKEVHGDLSNQ